MSKIKDIDLKQVRSINKNVRSSVRKLKPILKSIVGKKVEIAISNKPTPAPNMPTAMNCAAPA